MRKALELKIPPLAWFAITAALMWACVRWLPQWNFYFPGQTVLAASLVGEGLAVVAAGLYAMREANTTANPLNPERASSLVCHGIYCYTRNPMYVGMMLLGLGWFFYLGNLAALPFLANLGTCLHVFQILPEERTLQEKFADHYSQYRKRVPRWLFIR